MAKKIGSMILFLLLCILPGCGRAVPEQERDNRIMDASCLEAAPLSLVQNIQEMEELLKEEVCIKKTEALSINDKDIGEKNYAELETVIRNSDYEFFQIMYSERMAQFSYRNQMYMRSLQQDGNILIYDTSEAYWVNEVRVNDNYLYWVEYVSGETGTCYKVMQYQLDSGEISCIAERDDEVSELCIEVSDRFLTWYDIFMDGRVEIVVFDIEKQEFMERKDSENMSDGSVMLNTLYERLEIVEDCITYFLEDEEGRLYIRRENLRTGQTDTLLLGDKQVYRKLAGCFSDRRYIGWHTDYGWGSYYFYDMDTEALYCWDVKKDGMYVFSKFFSSGKFYFNNGEDDSVYAWDLSTGQAYRQNYGDGTGMQFEQYGEGLLNLEVWFEDRVELLTLCDDSY